MLSPFMYSSLVLRLRAQGLPRPFITQQGREAWQNSMLSPDHPRSYQQGWQSQPRHLPALLPTKGPCGFGAKCKQSLARRTREHGNCPTGLTLSLLANAPLTLAVSLMLHLSLIPNTRTQRRLLPAAVLSSGSPFMTWVPLCLWDPCGAM